MDSVLRGFAIFVFLLIIIRITGRRTIGQMNPFDFVLLLIIGEATQQALLGEDFSVTNAFIVIATLVGLDIVLSLVKQRSRTAEKVLDGTPTILIYKGEILKERLHEARVDEHDILESAREQFGFSTLDRIEHAVLEKTGKITILPFERERRPERPWPSEPAPAT